MSRPLGHHSHSNHLHQMQTAGERGRKEWERGRKGGKDGERTNINYAP